MSPPLLPTNKYILVPPFSLGAITEKNAVSLQFTYSFTGGSFSISLLRDSLPTLTENAQITLPNGRIGTVKSVGQGNSSGGLVDTISGPALPVAATLTNFVGLASNQTQSASSLASALAGTTVLWQTLDINMKGFVYRGNALGGVQQLASVMLADVIVRSDGIHVVDPGQIVGSIPFTVQKTDIVNITQGTDFSQDVKSVLNPALTTAQLIPDGQFVYDSDHAQKQPKFTVQAGAPGSEASSDFIPIPDGWLVDGNYEEWTPVSASDFTNPAASPLNGRYWKIFQSPTEPGMLRGITNFTRLIKQVNIPAKISTFVGSPVTGATLPDTGKAFVFDAPGTESGIYGFNSGVNTGLNPVGVSFFDIISHQFLSFPTAIVLDPAVGSSGDAASNFYSITMEMWTFPKVNPLTFPIGPPGNPFGLPRDVVVVSPSAGNIRTTSVSELLTYFTRYLANYKKINSPRLRTSVTFLYRGFIPQVGDQLAVSGGVPVQNCGRVASVGLSITRGGILVTVTAEVYQYGSGLYNLTT